MRHSPPPANPAFPRCFRRHKLECRPAGTRPRGAHIHAKTRARSSFISKSRIFLWNPSEGSHEPQDARRRWAKQLTNITCLMYDARHAAAWRHRRSHRHALRKRKQDYQFPRYLVTQNSCSTLYKPELSAEVPEPEDAEPYQWLLISLDKTRNPQVVPGRWRQRCSPPCCCLPVRPPSSSRLAAVPRARRRHTQPQHCALLTVQTNLVMRISPCAAVPTPSLPQV